MNESVRDFVLRVLRDEADARFDNALRDHAPGARASYDAIVELRALLTALPSDDPDWRLLSELAADGNLVVQEIHGVVGLYGRRLGADPEVFLATLLALSTTRGLERFLTRTL